MDSTPTFKRVLANYLLDHEMIKFGNFTLKDGSQSNVYIDLRKLISHINVLNLIIREFGHKIQNEKYDLIAGIPLAGVPLATALSLHMEQPGILLRKDAKNYGLKKMVEGTFQPGQKVLLVDDLITTSLSKLEAQQQLENANLSSDTVLVVIDRRTDRLADLPFKLISLITIEEIFEILQDQI